MKTSSFLILGLFLFSNVALSAQSPREICAALKDFSEKELKSTFVNSEMGEIPDGSTFGCVLGKPGLPLNSLVSQSLQRFWGGKVFDSKKGTVINKLLGTRAVPADVYVGTSTFDNQDTIIVEYPSGGHDELREIAPGVYLGRGYIDGFFGSYFATYFAVITDSNGE